MNKGHRFDAVFAVLEQRQRLLVLYVIGLEAQHAGNDLQVVLDPVVNFLEHDLLFPQGLFELQIRLFSRCHIAGHPPESHGSPPVIPHQ